MAEEPRERPELDPADWPNRPDDTPVEEHDQTLPPPDESVGAAGRPAADQGVELAPAKQTESAPESAAFLSPLDLLADRAARADADPAPRQPEFVGEGRWDRETPWPEPPERPEQPVEPSPVGVEAPDQLAAPAEPAPQLDDSFEPTVATGAARSPLDSVTTARPARRRAGPGGA
ncbi:MAG: hypothetical protein LBU05_00605, partial [Bifidobacteriaceae bacterium]|nr:hypothetical protein [Bifidobacteriaceae bacterium]